MTTRCAYWSSPPPTTSASRPAPTSRRSSMRRAGCAGCSLRRPLRRDRRLPQADDCGLPRRRGRWRGGDRRRLRHAGRRLQPSDALPGGGARRPGRPGPPGHPLRPGGRQVPAAHLDGVGADEALRWAWSTGSRLPPRPRRRRWSWPAEVAAPPEAVPAEAMLHEWDDVEGRSPVEGQGQVEWQRRPGSRLRRWLAETRSGALFVHILGDISSTGSASFLSLLAPAI